GGATSGDGYFTIDNAGQITLTVAGLAAGAASNDFETAPNAFTHGVQARDAAGNWSAAVNVTLNVLDVADTVVPDTTAPTVGAGQSFNYAENSATGTVVGTAVASDNVA